MQLFDYEDYRAFLRDKLKENRSARGYLSLFAKSVGCQNSYLSLVLQEKVHFTPEHAMGAATFWSFDDSETEYFLQLVNLGRTDFPPLRNKIRARLRTIIKEKENLAKRFEEDSIIEVKDQVAYYANWMTMAIHVILDIEKYRTVDAIAARLSISPDQVKQQLKNLETINLVKKIGDEWHYVGNNIHLPEDSILTVMNHQNWRSRAVIDSHKINSDSLHYTSVHTLSFEDFEKLKGKILKLIDEQRKTIGNSKAEEVGCFNCDWFRI